MPQQLVITISGASSGFGAMAARALAKAGHIVYAGMRATADRNAAQVQKCNEFSKENGVKLFAVEMDVASDESTKAAVYQIIKDQGHLDVVIHNVGHMTLGPLESFTPEQLHEI